MTGFSTRSVLHKRLSVFVDWIAPEPDTEDAIRAQADEVRCRIRGQAEADALTVRSTPNAGSFAKRTGLRRHFLGDSEVEGQDVDLPFVISPKTADDEQVDRLLERFEKYAAKSYPNTPRSRTKSSVKLAFVASKLAYDLVPMLATMKVDEQLLLRDDARRQRTSVQKNIEFIRGRTRSSNELPGRVKFNEAVRLLKWWREARVASAQTLDEVPSFFLELLAAKAYDTLSVRETYAETLASWFGFLADVVEHRRPVTFSDFATPPAQLPTPWAVLDPVNPENNAAARFKGVQLDEITEWFAIGRDTWSRAIRCDALGDDAGSLDALVALFGTAFKNHCEGA